MERRRLKSRELFNRLLITAATCFCYDTVYPEAVNVTVLLLVSALP